LMIFEFSLKFCIPMKYWVLSLLIFPFNILSNS
jgi:hypothetical protein